MRRTCSTSRVTVSVRRSRGPRTAPSRSWRSPASSRSIPRTRCSRRARRMARTSSRAAWEMCGTASSGSSRRVTRCRTESSSSRPTPAGWPRRRCSSRSFRKGRGSSLRPSRSTRRRRSSRPGCCCTRPTRTTPSSISDGRRPVARSSSCTTATDPTVRTPSPPAVAGATKVWLRLTSDGTQITASVSYDGAAFSAFGRPILVADAGFTHVGPFAFRGSTAAPEIPASLRLVPLVAHAGRVRGMPGPGTPAPARHRDGPAALPACCRRRAAGRTGCMTATSSSGGTCGGVRTRPGSRSTRTAR